MNELARGLKQMILESSKNGVLDAEVAIPRRPTCSTREVDWEKVPLLDDCPLKELVYIHNRFETDRLVYQIEHFDVLWNGGRPPHVVECEGEKFIVDGNHRVLILSLFGVDTFPCRVIQL